VLTLRIPVAELAKPRKVPTTTGSRRRRSRPKLPRRHVELAFKHSYKQTAATRLRTETQTS
jgi:hypothetical protein